MDWPGLRKRPGIYGNCLALKVLVSFKLQITGFLCSFLSSLRQLARVLRCGVFMPCAATLSPSQIYPRGRPHGALSVFVQ